MSESTDLARRVLERLDTGNESWIETVNSDTLRTLAQALLDAEERERASEAAHFRTLTSVAAEADERNAQNTRYREALERIANPFHHLTSDGDDTIQDWDEWAEAARAIAREALKEEA